jgi:sodium transport system permease protein
VNIPESAEMMLEAAIGGDILGIEADKADEYKQMITDSEADLLMIFPEGADSLFDGAAQPSTDAPLIALYYNSADTESFNVFQTVSAVLDGYESTVTNLFDINMGEEKYDLASDEAAAGQIFSMMMPMLLMMFMFSGCMAVAPESIAGEKERGTVATLLITPMKRSHLAIGKVVGSSVTALLSGLSSFIGVMLSLPKLMGEEIAEGASYGVTDYLLILAVMLSSVLLFVSIISVLSALASSVKEASTMLLPVMILVMGVGVSGMFTGSLPSTPALYLIPIYGSVSTLSAIFSYSVEPISVLFAVLSNIACSLGLTVLLAKMFASERVMFRR